MSTVNITATQQASIDYIETPWIIVHNDYAVGVYETSDQARKAKGEDGIVGRIVKAENCELIVIDEMLPDETITEKDEAELADALDAALDAEEDSANVYGFATHGYVRCPSCGCHLSNGVGIHNQEINGKLVKHEEFEFECLACGEEFGPTIDVVKIAATAAASTSKREAQKTSMKLDRTIVCLTAAETYRNAFHMWKSNPAWMTSAQQDRLTRNLYAAAKEGKPIVVEINGREFQLATVV